MIKRIFYTVQLMCRHISALRVFGLDPQKHAACITDIPLARFAMTSVSVVALDFDGVLAEHGKPMMREDVEAWVDGLIHELGADKVVLLSNKPTSDRKAYIEKRFPGVGFISGVRKKPYPDGLIKIYQRKHVKPEEVLLIDDRLLTGVLASIEAGCQAIWITEAYQDFEGGLLNEVFFAALRGLEKFFFLSAKAKK